MLTNSPRTRRGFETAARMLQQDIVKCDLHVKAFVQDIRDCGGPEEVLNTLNLQVSDNMKSMRKSIDELERLAMEQDSEKDKQLLLAEVEKYNGLFSSNRSALRRANLSCQMLIDKKNKEELFERDESQLHHRVRADKEHLVKQSSSATDCLHAISSMMADQVKQSEETLHTLVSSSSTVTDTSEEFKTMGSAIQQSRKLLTKYGRRELTDKVLILLALAFFFACVFYVIKKRLFY